MQNSVCYHQERSKQGVIDHYLGITHEELIGKYEAQIYRFAVLLVDDLVIAEHMLCEAFIHTFDALNTERVSDEKSFLNTLYAESIYLAQQVNARAKEQNSNKYSAIHQVRRPLNMMEISSLGLSTLVYYLPLWEKVVFVMKDMDGLNRAQIAEILQMPIMDIRQCLHNARRTLRKLFYKPSHSQTKIVVSDVFDRGFSS
ncbi:MAG: hypothetical protein IT292_11465 [Deltaproteobacteria bacterium]|nr:hypothetical protein [Deltaproteobacteria bacterium]